jgi:tetratricopeptide (TPR) repeat protein
MHFWSQTPVCDARLRNPIRGITQLQDATMTGWRGCGLLLSLILAAGCSSQRADSEASALDYFKRGNQAFQKEDYRHAIRMYRQASVMDPRSAVIQYNLGLACYEAETYPEAVQAYTRALQLDPTLAEAHRNLALTEDRLYHLDAAQSHYNAYQALVRTQQAKADASAADAKGDAAAGAKPAANTAGAADRQTPSRPAVRKPAGSTKDGPPESVSELRRYGEDAKANGSSAKSGGDNKWWIQDSSSRNR